LARENIFSYFFSQKTVTKRTKRALLLFGDQIWSTAVSKKKVIIQGISGFPVTEPPK